MTENAYLIPLLPFIGFVMIVFALRWKEKVAAGFSIAMILSSWVFSIIVLIETIGRDGAPYEAFFYITSFDTLNFEIGILIDSLTAMMLIVVSTVASCVQIYSLGYMKDDPRFSRFFAYLSLFCFSMLGLVIANNFFMIFIFWELVGLTSYLLIGFWFEKKSASDAGKKAFITTRIGDLGMIVGLLLIAGGCGTFNYNEIFSSVAAGTLSPTMLTTGLIFLFAGAVGKSAQFPLHVWLPDAMEGPTPVSALIHAATMVVAGVYLVARAMPLFESSATASMVVAIIGITTSVMAASIGLVQNDIKRVLAYSTVSQLGYMIMALGLYGYDTAMGEHSPGYYAGTFHLMTHAFFKALLFLGAGSVIHAVHTNNIQEMGGLLPKMKITAWTFMIASLSISGIFPFAGFWSKDEIVATASTHPVFMFFTLAVAFMTAFYMWRLCFLTFWGKPRDQHRFDHAHESPRSMSWPLAFLGILAVGAGWVGMPWLKAGFASFVYSGEAYKPHADYMLMGVSTVVAVSGIGLAWLMYAKQVISPDKMVARFKPIHKLLLNKYYFDEIYDFIIIRPVLAFGRYMWTFDARIVDGLVNGVAWLVMIWSDIKMWFDKWIIDGAVNGAGWVISSTSSLLRLVQTGAVQFYALFILASIVILAVVKYEVVYNDVSWPVLSIILLAGLYLLSLVSKSVAEKAKTAAAATATDSGEEEK